MKKISLMRLIAPRYCPRCNHAVQEDQTACPECGVVFAQWDAAHSSSPASVSATGRFKPRHQKYFGLVLVILGLVLMCLASGKFWAISWLISGIGLAMYAKGRGYSLLLGLVPYVGPLIGLLVFAKDNNREERTILNELVMVAIFVGLGAIAITAMQDFSYKERMANVQIDTIEPILAALEEYYKKNGRFPVSTTATTVTPSMSGTLDKGPDVWTSMGSDRYPVFHNKSRGSLVSQLDYTSDATGSTMTLRLTLSNFGTDSIDGKIISVTPSPEKEPVITWISNCSFEKRYCVDPNPFCRRYPSSPACR